MTWLLIFMLKFLIFIGHWSKQKKHLIKVSLRNKPIIVEDSSFEEDLSSEEGFSFDKNSKISSDDEIMWADSELDNEPENTLKKLVSDTKNIKSKQPLQYIGNSIRTQKRCKAAAKKMVIQNGNTITQFFLPIQNEPNTQTDDTHSNELEGHDNINSSSM
ncbi:865_t:CDS:2, partial [Funneliformis caledonium]